MLLNAYHTHTTRPAQHPVQQDMKQCSPCPKRPDSSSCFSDLAEGPLCAPNDAGLYGHTQVRLGPLSSSNRADFSTVLSILDRKTRQEINKETEVVNSTTDQLDPRDRYRTHPPGLRATIIKLLEVNDEKASGHWFCQWFIGQDTKNTGNNMKK